jgi:hypothetical protein
VRRVRPVRLITPRTALLPYNTGRTLQRRFRGWDRDSGAGRHRCLLANASICTLSDAN